jgi:hypothetical protein
MSLFFPHHAKSQNQQSQASEKTRKPAFQTVAQQQAQPQAAQTAAVKVILSAHQNHPKNNI